MRASDGLEKRGAKRTSAGHRRRWTKVTLPWTARQTKTSSASRTNRVTAKMRWPRGCDHQLPWMRSPAIASASEGTGPCADSRTTPSAALMEWTPPETRRALWHAPGGAATMIRTQGGVSMSATVIAVDVAKSVFEIAVSTQPGRIVERHRPAHHSWHRPAQRHRARRLRQRRAALPLRPPFRQLPWSHPARALQRPAHHLGAISKRGDPYLRLLLIHGAIAPSSATPRARRGAHAYSTGLSPSNARGGTTKPPSRLPTSLLASPGRCGPPALRSRPRRRRRPPSSSPPRDRSLPPHCSE